MQRLGLPAIPKKENRVPRMENAVISEGDGVRTRNHRIDSPGDNSNSQLKNANSESCLASCLSKSASAGPLDTDLQTIVDSWPKLPADGRRMISGVVKATLAAKAGRFPKPRAIGVGRIKRFTAADLISAGILDPEPKEAK
jgi:hypothetical protein